MNTEERIKQQRELVEKIGHYYDKEGFQPIAGRILGLLMVMDKEQYTFDEITEELQISKSSASNALRNLEIRGNIEYVTIPGDRKRYFQLKRYGAAKMIEEFERKMIGVKEMLGKIVQLKADRTSQNTLFFNEVSEFISSILEKINQSKVEQNK